MKAFLIFMARFLASLAIAALAGTMLWNTYTNFVIGGYADAAPASSSFIVGILWPLVLLTAAIAAIYYIWRKPQ